MLAGNATTWDKVAGLHEVKMLLQVRGGGRQKGICACGVGGGPGGRQVGLSSKRGLVLVRQTDAGRRLQVQAGRVGAAEGFRRGRRTRGQVCPWVLPTRLSGLRVQVWSWLKSQRGPDKSSGKLDDSRL